MRRAIGAMVLAMAGAGVGCDDGSSGATPDAVVDRGPDGTPGPDAAPAIDATIDAAPIDAASTGDALPPDAAPIDAAPIDPASIDTAPLRAAMEQALGEAPNGVEGMTLLVHDETDTRVIELTVGDSAPDRRMPVASASKMVSALVFLRLIEEGTLGFDQTPGAVLGWQGPFAEATLDMLAAFTSGMPGNTLCTTVLRTTLAECAANMEALDPLGAPGAVYDYGSTHMHVAAAMAEAQTGELWDALFRRTVTVPLGIDDPAVRYVTRPQQMQGETNPLIAGGLIITPDAYARILSMVFHRGRIDGEAHIAPALVERMGENHYPEAAVMSSPAQMYGFDYYYGFGSWLQCDGPVQRCGVFSSPGAFGFTPWVDWDRGIYAILAMDRGQTGGAQFSMQTVDALSPLIHEALGR